MSFKIYAELFLDLISTCSMYYICVILPSSELGIDFLKTVYHKNNYTN